MPQPTPGSSLHHETVSSAAERVYRRYLAFGSLVKGGRVIPHWLSDGSSFWYNDRSSELSQVIRFDAATETVAPLFDWERLQHVLRTRFSFAPTDGCTAIEQLEFFSHRKVSFDLKGQRCILDLDSYELELAAPPSRDSYADLVYGEVERPRPREFARWKFYATGRRVTCPEAVSSDGRWMAGIEDHNLVLRASADGQVVNVTSDGTPEAFWDFDTTLWNPWSPTGAHLALIKQHCEGMARVPTIEWLQPLEELREIIALPAGGTLYRSELQLFDMSSRRPLPVNLGDTSNQYVRILQWTPDGAELLLARYSRRLDRVELAAVNALTRAIRTLLIEECVTFLAHHHEVLWSQNTGFTLLPDASGFIWRSDRTGWRHLYLYDITGHLVRPLTSGTWPVHQVLRADLANGWVYFTGHGDAVRLYDTHLYRVRLDGGGCARLTEGRGRHSIHLSPSGNYFLDTYSAVDTPPRTELRRSDGTLVRSLREADISALREVGWVPPQEHVVKAADEVTDLWVTLYLPYDFDSNKKYPVVEYIYGGPQTIARALDFADQAFDDRFPQDDHFNRALANLGFIVLTLDARGTPGRSKAFQDYVVGRFGQFEIADHAVALRQLADRLSFLDLTRIGVWGWSWGGQFAFRALTQAPELYKFGICGWPAFDLHRFMLYEIYLGIPQGHSHDYRVADTFALAPRLQGHVLLIGGMNDPSTQADLFKMSEALIRLGKQHQMMCYPYCGHGASGLTAEYDMELKKNFFLQHLLGVAPADRASCANARK